MVGVTTTILALGILCQVLVERIKPVLPSKIKDNGHNIQLISIIFGVVIAVFGKADIFAQVGVQIETPIVAYVLTGLIISGGASAINDVFKLIAGAKDNKYATPEPVVEEPKPVVLNEEKPATEKPEKEVLAK